MNRPIENMNLSATANVMLVCYFGGALFTSGAIGLVAPSEVGTLLADVSGGTVGAIYSWAIVVVGLSGLGAMLAQSRRAEFYALLGASAMMIFNGLLMLPEYPQTAMQQMFAWAIIIPFGWMRMGFTISPGQVVDVRRQIERDTPGGAEDVD